MNPSDFAQLSLFFKENVCKTCYKTFATNLKIMKICTTIISLVYYLVQYTILVRIARSFVESVHFFFHFFVEVFQSFLFLNFDDTRPHSVSCILISELRAKICFNRFLYRRLGKLRDFKPVSISLQRISYSAWYSSYDRHDLPI